MRVSISYFLYLYCILSFGQSLHTSGFFNYHLADRNEIQLNEITNEFYTGIKPYRRDAVRKN